MGKRENEKVSKLELNELHRCLVKILVEHNVSLQ